MAARTGAEYIKGLQAQDHEVWLRGERVKDVTTHPGLANGVRAIASLYDQQHDPKLRDEMTYVSLTSGERLGLSFIIPRTQDELQRRGAMMLRWARTTCGMMGRSPDFMNVTFAAWAAASSYFGRGRPQFAENIKRYYEYLSENDLTLTHSLINLQRSRTLTGVFNLQEGTALQVVRETDAGIVVHGARILATLGPLADEIAVYSPRVARHTETHSPFALNFAIPCSTPGLRFLCRESFDLGRSHFEHPLGSRFEEMDCVVFFDNVLVPWERVFLLGDVDLLNGTATTTNSMTHTAHQGAAKNIAKCEFVLGLALLMTEDPGQRAAAALRGAPWRVDALHRADEGLHARRRGRRAARRVGRHVSGRAAGREHAQSLHDRLSRGWWRSCSSSAPAASCSRRAEADFSGPLASHIEQYLATDTATARDRVKLFRLAWDVAGSAFGSRQVLYERFFASDPLTRARALSAIYPKDETMERVREFLADE